MLYLVDLLEVLLEGLRCKALSERIGSRRGRGVKSMKGQRNVKCGEKTRETIRRKIQANSRK
jgi:hypothetical protein